MQWHRRTGDALNCSIIMPAFNSRNFIGSAIKSIQNQSDGNWELLVSDDGSTDGTVDRVREAAADDARIKILSTRNNRGIAQARNVAIEVAAGRYIAFLDSDDLWKPEKLERQLGFMQQRDIAFSFSSYDRVDATGAFISTHCVRKPVTYSQLLKSNVIGCLTAVYDTEKVGKVYCPDIQKRQDFGLWLRVLKLVDFAYPIPESLAQYRVHAGSISANKLHAARATWSVYRDVEDLSFAASLYYFSHYATRGFYNTYVKPRLEK